MPRVENTILIDRSPDEVFDYCAELTNELEWNPVARSIERLSTGPIGVGTTYRARFGDRDPMTIEYVAFDRPRHWAMVGKPRGGRFGGGGTVTPEGEGARLVYTMELHLDGVLGLLGPLMARRMYRVQERNLANIKARVEARIPSSHKQPTATE